jgi:hypothetical protein
MSGAITVTASLMLAVYAVVNGNEAGWGSAETLGLLAGAVVLLITFIVIEARVRTPLMPLGLFRLRNLTTANIIGVLWAAAMFAWFFITTLYLQAVLGFTPLPDRARSWANIIMWHSRGLSASCMPLAFVVARARPAVGAAGLAFCACAGGSNVAVDVLPSMILLGLAAGIAFNPLLLAAMNDVKPTESGLASGVVNTAFMMGGSLGLAVLASLAAGRTQHLLASGTAMRQALNGGYHAAFVVGAIFAGISALLGVALVRVNVHAQSQAGAAAEAAIH